MTNKFRNSTNGRYLREMFFETSREKSNVLYTLKDVEHLGFPSLYIHYMEMEDLTEYEFASKYLDGYEHWTMLCECTWFVPYVSRWRKELELRVKGRALRALQEIALDPSHRSAATVNQFLVKGGWKEQPTKGRPSKDDVRKAAKEEAQNSQQLKEDWKLIHAEKEPESLH